MKFRICALIIAFALAAGCSGNKGSDRTIDTTTEETTVESEDLSDEETTKAAETTEAIPENKNPETEPSAQNTEAPIKISTYTNEYGFSMEYDSDVFEKLTMGEDGAYFGALTNSSAYVSVRVASKSELSDIYDEIGKHYGDTADWAAISTQLDNVSAEKAEYDEESDGVKVKKSFYFIPLEGTSTAVVEMSVPEEADSELKEKLESIVNSFSPA